ncbi:MAG: SMP-30/gluconolactonase/LRE family protein [Pirellulales bacterium]
MLSFFGWFALATEACAAPPTMPATVADGAELTVVYTAEKVFFEGPTWDPQGKKLYFTAFTADNSQILRLDGPNQAAVWMDKSQGVNGTYLSLDGRLLGAQAFGHRLVSYGFGEDGPGTPETLLYAPGLNQPNDVCQVANGDIYFSDPDFNKRERSAVFRYSPDGQVAKIISDMPLPNGVIASNDAQTLYVGDSHERNWRAYPISDKGQVGPGRLFFDPGNEDRREPDGMSIDEQGNLYLTGRGGVWVADPDGKALGLIPIVEFCANVTFGGDDGKTLYMTCQDKLYSLSMKVRGGQFKP